MRFLLVLLLCPCIALAGSDLIPKRTHRILFHTGVGPFDIDKKILGDNVFDVTQEYAPVVGVSYSTSYNGWVWSAAGFSNLTFVGGVGREF